MKSYFIIITALALLACPSVSMAQEKMKGLFQKIEQFAGVTHVGEQKASYTDSAGVTSESCITIIKVKKAYFPAVFDKLKETFDSESRYASMVYEYTADDNTYGINVSPRQLWSLWRDGASPIIVGSISNSNYLVANFDDQEHPGYRTCYAAEWSDTDDPEILTGKLIYVYGHKPEMQTNHRYSIKGFETIPSNSLISNELREKLQELKKLKMVDSVLSNFIVKELPGEKQGDIPVKEDLTEWMNKAVNNVKHLSNSDWHRIFGLLTQKMMDRADEESAEDQVVASGIILELCKNAYQLDADEREVSARRLERVAATLKSNQYVHDLLMLGAKKLKKKQEQK